MGNAACSGRSNKELVDNLVTSEFIETKIIERVFRAVDRGEYYLPGERDRAYRDVAWKNGNLHLSSPCVYSRVLEGLNVQPGMSFLNIGSGTGYLSTMVGLILGTYGLNHGIEIFDDVINYANEKLDEFKKTSTALDEFEFAEPIFFKGNIYNLIDKNKMYDRVYCGANCPRNFLDSLKPLIKIGGILVVPSDDSLLQITRETENFWIFTPLLSVSFATLVEESEEEKTKLLTLPIQPINLQVACRSVIRSLIRKNIDKDHPEIERDLNSRKQISNECDYTDNKTDKLVCTRHCCSDTESDIDMDPASESYYIETLNNMLNGFENENGKRPGTGPAHRQNCRRIIKRCVSAQRNWNQAETSIREDSSSEDSNNEEPVQQNNGDENSSDSDEEPIRATAVIIQHGTERIIKSDSDSSDANEDLEVVYEKYISPYTVHLVDRIKKLPLPYLIRDYVNYNRGFD